MDKRILKIAKKIRQLRIEKGYVSNEFFAWEHNIPRVQYWRMEKGTNFTIKTFLRILDAHEMTLEDFFKDFES
ncbi:MAG: XRE family transcriptional regulator [Flavobacteriaceae bacterium]|nr:XRE family transcriptional regulator [Flavobacteriaceae bacterium]